eukprot:3932642-Rhodomonas_salina.2
MVAALLLPLYNAMVYIPARLLTVVLLPGLQFDPSLLLRFLQSLSGFVVHSVVAFSDFMRTFQACPMAQNGTLVSNACFEAGLRTLDVITPMADVRHMAGYAVGILGLNCRLLSVPVDLLLYPLMDINFAKAVHALVNSVLLAVLHVPLITYERCRHASGDGSHLQLLMCVPDFEPAWHMFSAGARFLGRTLDNWANIAAVILEEAITGESPRCDVPPLAEDVAAPRAEVFGLNETITVGLTPGMYARTDGWSTEYTVFHTVTERTVVLHSWPIPVTVAHGVAAVQYTDADERDESGSATTSMLGCTCRDVVEGGRGRVAINCAISPYDPESYDTMHRRLDSYVLPVEFQVPQTASHMTCAQLEISVQSVRWPLSRLARPDTGGVLRNFVDPVLDIADGEEARELDAVLYVTPRCEFSTATQAPDLVCVESFREARCFPFCMAGRLRGSMNSALVLRDADDWSGYVQLTQRDCGLGEMTVTEQTEFYFTGDAVPEPAGTVSSFSTRDGYVGGETVTRAPTPGDASRGACTYDRNVVSRYPTALLPAYADLQSMRREEQPFVVAGDATLTIEWEGEEASVRVRRLFGSESNQFTLKSMPQLIPALQACRHMASCDLGESSCVEGGDTCGTRARDAVLTVPRAYSRSPGNAAPAAATKWSVLFAVNPDPNIYASFYEQCRYGANVEMSLQVDSAYAPIRIWRVDAFVEDASLAAQMRRDDVSLTIDAFDRNVSASVCAQPRNLTVTSLAYLNEYNVAVTVLRASARYYDVETKRACPDAPPGSDAVSYDTYYLNPQRMQLRRDRLWEEETPASALAQGVLCPAMRRVPPVGG